MASAAAPKMEYVYLGNSGIKVSTLCLGTMNFGEFSDGRATQCGEKESHAILDAYVAAGGNFIDCANVYAGGESEAIVGRWIAAHPAARSSLVLATKARFPTTAAAGVNGVGLSRSNILASLADSLARLQTSYIDLWQCHAWDAGTPLEETLRALDDCVKSGKVRYIGWSNVTGAQLQLIACETRRLGLAPCVSLQAQYSLLCRETEFELTDVCEREGIALLPWSALKGGWLTGKMKRDAPPPADSRVAWAEAAKVKMQSHPTFSQFADDDAVWALLDVMDSVAKEAGASMTQVALRWLLQKSPVASIVIGVKSVTQLTDQIAVLGVKLTEAQMARLDAASAVDIPYPYEMVWRVQATRQRVPGRRW